MEDRSCFGFPPAQLIGPGGTMNPGDNERRYRSGREKTASDKEMDDGDK